MYPIALDSDIKPGEFWDYSLGEILDLINSYNRRYTRDSKARIDLAFTQSMLIGSYYASLWSKDTRIPEKWDVYPSLFEKDRIAYEESQRLEEMENYKEKRRQYALQHNQRRKASS